MIIIETPNHPDMDAIGSVAVRTISEQTPFLIVYQNVYGGCDGWVPLDTWSYEQVQVYLAENQLVKVRSLEGHSHALAGVYVKGKSNE